MGGKKKAVPKPPSKIVKVIPPRTIVEQVFDVVIGRGLRPLHVWFSATSTLLLMNILLVENANKINGFYLLALWASWTAPLESIAEVLRDIGKIRESLADVIPLLPGIAPYAPEMLRILVPNTFKLLPAAGTMAPYLKYLLKYPDFAAKALPHMVPKMDIFMEYNMIEMIGPSFAEMDMRHYSKIEKILPDMMAKLDMLAPYFHIIAPHIVEISLRADRLFPYVEYMLPHAETMKDHIWWLIPFADIDGYELFMPHLDVLAPFVEDLAPHGPELLPYFAKINKHIPILIENAETLVPQL